MDQTDVWMLGVGAFGIAFYLIALSYQRGSKKDKSDT